MSHQYLRRGWKTWTTAGAAAGSSLLIAASVLQDPNERKFVQAEPLLLLNYRESVLEDHRLQFNHHHNNNTTKTQPATQPYPISVRAIKNARITMEDEYCIHDTFYAIFDGHGGGGVSRYLKRHLYETIQNYTKHQQAAPAQALQYAFRDMEQSVTKDEALKYQGSTAVAVWIQAHELISANVGDSRAVLSRDKAAIDLTRDHKPNDELEKERILTAGETITWDRFSKVHRVRNLSLSRAIGDVYAKPVVSGTVDIKHFARSSKDEFIIIASDGLWDVMTSDEAVAFCHETLGKIDNPNHTTVARRTMAKLLTREAVQRGSGDNVCVVMIWLKDDV